MSDNVQQMESTPSASELPQAAAAGKGGSDQDAMVRSEKDLLRSLMRELFQSERSAQRHPRVEAQRLPDTPPGRALEAVARHADAISEELPRRAQKHGLPVSLAGLAAGSTFSQLRRNVFDLFMDVETSYRATLLGMRHGLDVMRMLREAGMAAGDEELAEWSERIYEARAPLVEECAQQLSWFAKNPEKATTPVMGSLLMKGMEFVKERFGRMQLARAERASSKAA